jgi:hypothetical protein
MQRLLARSASAGFLLILSAALLVLGVPDGTWAQGPGNGFTYSATEGVRRQYTSGGDIFSGELLVENSTNDVSAVTAGATGGVIGVAVDSAPNNGQPVNVGLLGAFTVSIDAPCAFGQFVAISATNAGYGHCQSNLPSAQVIGLAETSGSGSVTVLINPLVSTPAAASITNGSTSNTEFLFDSQGSVSPQSVMTYDTTFGPVPRVDFTNQAGWDSPVLFRNAQAPQNSFTVFPVNTDGQFEIQEFALGTLTALLNLDSDGHVFLYGNAGGGFATDIYGNTCLAGGNLSLSPCSGAEAYNNDGKMTRYWGQNLAGNGISIIVGTVDVAQTGSYGPTVIFTTNSNVNGPASGGLYRLDVYAVATSGVSGSTIQFQVNYTDADFGSEAQNSGSSVSFAHGGNLLTCSFIINPAASTTISLLTNTTGSPVYTLHARLQAL